MTATQAALRGTLSFSAGRLLCGNVRGELEKLKFLGHDISYFESGGFFSHYFIVKANISLLEDIKKSIEDWEALK